MRRDPGGASPALGYLRAPRGLPEAEYDAMRLALDGKPFRARLRRAVRAVFGKSPSLSKVRVELSR